MRGKVLITGASGGIGSSIAKRFADAGWSVALQYNTNRDAIDSLVRTFPADAAYLCLQCDLTSAEDVRRMVDDLHRRFGTVSVLVNCAGKALAQKLLSDTTDDEYDLIFATNVQAPVRLTRLLVDDLRANHGAVVNVSSMWGVTGASCEVLYSASKAAVIGFTKALAKELAPSDVTVNAVAPGLIDTAMNAHLSEEDLAAFAAETPLQRIGTPQDVADAVFWLANARFVTGQVLCCDGGCTI
ncbi:MAG: SDR family oxidoreductase [Clostridia bacterium]|nr:SDR family oxidoreductase [Clostridia bacterium]